MFFDFVIVIKILMGDYSTDLWYQCLQVKKMKAVCCIKTSEREKGGEREKEIDLQLERKKITCLLGNFTLKMGCLTARSTCPGQSLMSSPVHVYNCR